MGIAVFQLEFVVTAVAECAFSAMFTAAKVNGFSFFRSKCNGSKRCGFVTAIAKRLIFTQATRAPAVGLPGSDFDGKG